MAPWNDKTKRTIRGLFTNRFAPKLCRGVTGVTMVMGELVWGSSVIGGRRNGNIVDFVPADVGTDPYGHKYDDEYNEYYDDE